MKIKNGVADYCCIREKEYRILGPIFEVMKTMKNLADYFSQDQQEINLCFKKLKLTIISFLYYLPSMRALLVLDIMYELIVERSDANSLFTLSDKDVITVMSYQRLCF